MAWLKDPAWQQGLALLLVVAGAILIYRGVPSLGELDGVALLGVALFAVGVALPLISQILRAHRENPDRCEDV